VKKAELPTITEEQVLIKVKATSICNRTDVHTIEGTHPPHNKFVEGYTTNPPDAFPCPLGHEGAGEIVKVGKCVHEYEVGDRVATVGVSSTMSEYIACPPEWMCKIPDNVSYEEASPLEMLMTVTSMVSGCVYPGAVVAIIGQGGAGLMATQCAKIWGAKQVIVSEPNPEKRKLALKLGADLALDPKQDDVVKEISRLTNGRGVDTAIECVGTPPTIQMCLKLIKFHIDFRTWEMGRYPPYIGVYGACTDPREVPFNFFELHHKGAQIITGSSTHLGYTNYTLRLAAELVSTGRFKMKPLITHRFPIDEVATAFKMIMEGKETYVKVVILPEA